MPNNYKNPAEIFKPFVRDGSFPIDISSRYFSYNEAKNYAENDPSAYAGQLISVVNGENVSLYQVIYGSGGNLTLGQVMTQDSGSNYLAYKGTIGAEVDHADYSDFLHEDIGSFKAGWVFRVVTTGKYIGLNLEKGDEVTAIKDWDTEYDLPETNKSAYWSVIQSNLVNALQYDSNERAPSPYGIPMFTESGYNSYIVQNSGLKISYDNVSLFGITLTADDRSRVVNISGSAAQTDYSLVTLYDSDSPLVNSKLYFNGSFNNTDFDQESPDHGNTLLDLRADSLNVVSNRRLQTASTAEINTDLPEEWLKNENDQLPDANKKAKVPTVSALAEAVAGRPREYYFSAITRGNYNKSFYDVVIPANSFITEIKVMPRNNFPYSTDFRLYLCKSAEDTVEIFGKDDADLSDSSNYYIIRPEYPVSESSYIMMNIINNETTESDGDLVVDVLIKYDIPIRR